ncbi:MAG: molybdopterin-guanine dinucleotide biosynthesis protein B [Candidatus Methanomethylicia archaeon]
MNAFAIIGKRRGVGKTELGLKIVRYLKDRNIPVVVIKHAHKIDLDDKDSFKYFDVGADNVITVSSDFTLTISKPARSIEDFSRSIDSVVVIEGFKTSNLPKIIVARNLDDLNFRFNGYVIAAVVSEDLIDKAREIFPGSNVLSFNDLNALSRLFRDVTLKALISILPNIDCRICGYSTCLDFAKNIVDGVDDIYKCVKYHDDIIVKVNGLRLNLGKFPREILKNILIAYLKTLKGIPEKLNEIEVYIKNKQ